MTEPRPKALGQDYGEQEDTDPTTWTAKIPGWTWYRKTTRAFGLARPFFMPLGFWALCALAFYLGFPMLEELCDSLLYSAHLGLSALGRLFGSADLENALLLDDRRSLAPVLATWWASLAVLILGWGARPVEPDEKDLGYIVPGSGILARTWANLGRPLFWGRRGLVFLLSYFRDLNLEKIYLPVSLVAVMVLAVPSMVFAMANLLAELPANIPALRPHSAWIQTSAWAATGFCMVYLGLPFVINSLLRSHQKSVRYREKKVHQVWRRLTGLFGLLLVFLPVAWMTVGLLAGELF